MTTYIKRLDDVTALEITEHHVCNVVTLLHRGERVHTTQCAPHLLARVIEDHVKIYAEDVEDASIEELVTELQSRNREEIVVKCSLCGDEWHTLGKVGELEGCTDCDEVFEIQPEDVVLNFDDFVTDEYSTHVALCAGHAKFRITSGGAIGTCGVLGCTEDAESYYTFEEEEQ